jgi:uncharacterized membrane protein YgdD (TMEM256/DUF423 family)
MSRTFTVIAAVFGLLAVLAGTFAAHGLAGRISDADLAVWETAARYHMYHALALLAVAWAAERFRSPLVGVAGWLLTAGIVIFAGTLYLLALSETLFGARQNWLGMITPVGGLSFLAGWLCLALGAIRAARG